MRRISILLNVLFFCHIFTVAQSVSDWQKVKYISGDENIAVFTSEGEASKKSEVGKDAKCRLFYALFYKGVIGFNDTQPLICVRNLSVVTQPRSCQYYFGGKDVYEETDLSTSDSGHDVLSGRLRREHHHQQHHHQQHRRQRQHQQFRHHR